MSDIDPRPSGNDVQGGPDAEPQPASPEGPARTNRRATIITGVAFLIGVAAVITGFLTLGGGSAATEKVATTRLVKQAFQAEEADKKEEFDRQMNENGARISQLNGPKRTEYFAAYKQVNEKGVKNISPAEVATLKRYAPDYLASRYAMVHLQEKGYDSLTDAERASALLIKDVSSTLRKEAKESALRDPLWKEFQGLLELPPDAAEPFGLLSAADRKQAVEYAKQAKERGLSSLTVDDVRLLIRAGADGYLKRLAGI
jgi:hypothetical protein